MKFWIPSLCIFFALTHGIVGWLAYSFVSHKGTLDGLYLNNLMTIDDMGSSSHAIINGDRVYFFTLSKDAMRGLGAGTLILNGGSPIGIRFDKGVTSASEISIASDSNGVYISANSARKMQISVRDADRRIINGSEYFTILEGPQ